jgi:hypothetical protein
MQSCGPESMSFNLHQAIRRSSAAVFTAALATLALTACTGITQTKPTTSTPARPTLTIDGTTILITSGTDRMRLDARTLAMTVQRQDAILTISDATTTALGEPTTPSLRDGVISWRYPAAGIDAEAGPDNATGGVVVRFARTAQATVRSLEWPRTGTDETVGSVQYANGSGQNIPIRDSFWNQGKSELPGATFKLAGDLTLPAWGVTAANGTLGAALSTTTDIGTTLAFTSEENLVRATTAHAFTPDTNSYAVTISPTDGSSIAAGVAYRRSLIAADTFVTLDEKIRTNPAVAQLIGAPHAYVWGSGRKSLAIKALQDAGVKQMWLGYDTGGDVPTNSFVDDAQKAGFLVGPYDSWANAQDPATSDAPTSTWPGNLYPDGCVRDTNGDVQPGFGGRGCYLSSTALDQAQHKDKVITDRVTNMTHNGTTSYFLDVDAAGQLFTDSSPDHLQTEIQDRALRLGRMKALTNGDYSDRNKLVVGSETAAAWANPAIAFSHGSSTPIYDGIWAAQKDRETWGAYWPEHRPGFFFKPTEISQSLATAMFSPKYRIPLYEAALHDSVISSDRWEIGIGKLPQVRTERALTSMLYNEPIMHTLDGDNITANADALAKEQAFYSKLQHAAGTKPLTGYQHLTSDGTVQQTQFGNGALTITANYGSKPAHGVPAGCVAATTPNAPVGTYCATQ